MKDDTRDVSVSDVSRCPGYRIVSSLVLVKSSVKRIAHEMLHSSLEWAKATVTVHLSFDSLVSFRPHLSPSLCLHLLHPLCICICICISSSTLTFAFTLSSATQVKSCCFFNDCFSHVDTLPSVHTVHLTLRRSTLPSSASQLSYSLADCAVCLFLFFLFFLSSPVQYNLHVLINCCVLVIDYTGSAEMVPGIDLSVKDISFPSSHGNIFTARTASTVLFTFLYH